MAVQGHRSPDVLGLRSHPYTLEVHIKEIQNPRSQLWRGGVEPVAVHTAFHLPLVGPFAVRRNGNVNPSCASAAEPCSAPEP
jgi:hypothetical protein